MLGWFIAGFLWPAVSFVAGLTAAKYILNDYPSDVDARP